MKHGYTATQAVSAVASRLRTLRRVGRLAGIAGLVGLFLALAGSTADLQADDGAAAAPVAVVNDHSIAASELEFLYLLRRVPEERRGELRGRFVEELIDQRLMAEFLESRRAAATPEELDSRIADVRQMISRGGNDPVEVLAKVGVTEEMLQKTLALPLAWNQHVRRVVTDEQLLGQFTAHRARYDGSRRRVSQIVLTLPPEADEAARHVALQELVALKQELDAGRMTFAAAAKEHSQSPSKEQGGDMGWGIYGQRIPREIADVAFDLPVGQVSEPFLSRFGAHLLVVTEEEPGQLSLEDVRGEVLAEMGRGLWSQQLAELKAAAKISRNNAPPEEPVEQP